LLYWNIGKIIVANTKYGTKFVENLANDIKAEFPDAKGYSARRLKYMRKFAETISDEQKVLTVSALLSWSHNILLLDKAKTQEEILWYAKQVIESGWSLSVLEYHLETKAYQRQAIADKTTNYERLLPSPFSELAQETLKSPYIFDFIEKRKGINFYLSAIDDILKHETDNPSIGIMLCKTKDKLTAE